MPLIRPQRSAVTSPTNARADPLSTSALWIFTALVVVSAVMAIGLLAVPLLGPG